MNKSIAGVLMLFFLALCLPSFACAQIREERTAEILNMKLSHSPHPNTMMMNLNTEASKPGIHTMFTHDPEQRTKKYTKSGYIAAISEELLDKAIEYVVNKDMVALEKLMSTGFVFFLRGGVEVYIVQTKIFSGTVKIRPVGETAEVWTVIEAVSN